MDLPSERLPRTRGEPCPALSQLPRGVSARGRPRVSGGVRSSLLRGILVAAAYSLCLITELCPFCLHSAFSNLSILVLTELSSPEPSALDLCCWGGSGVGLSVGLLISRFPCAPWLDPATPLPESLHQLPKAGSPQPPPALCSILPNGQVAYFPPKPSSGLPTSSQRCASFCCSSYPSCINLKFTLLPRPVHRLETSGSLPGLFSPH